MPQSFSDNQKSRTGISRREALTEKFSIWEQNSGRGWQVFDYEIELEPAFSRFVSPQRVNRPIDDGRVPTLFSRLFSNKKVSHQLSNNDEMSVNNLVQLQPKPAIKTVSFRIYLPSELKISSEQTEQLLQTLVSSTSFISFEIIGTRREIVFQITCPTQDKQSVLLQLKSHLPTGDLRESEDALAKNLDSARTNESVTVDFGLGKEWFIPISFGKSFATDTLLPLIASMEKIAEGETISLQVLFSRARGVWQRAVEEAIFDRNGKPIFSYLQNHLSTIKEKLSHPLFAVQIRLVAQSGSKEKSLQLARQTSAFFRQFSSPSGNELIPLQNSGLDADKHLQSFLHRTNYRSGMLLSVPELSAIIHFPSDTIISQKLCRADNCTKRAPEFATQGNIILGENHHAGQTQIIKLSNEQRLKHLWITGASGCGKSTIITEIAEQDFKIGNGGCVLEPHGDLIENIIARIPEHRVKDVILFDPADEHFPIGFNPLQANSELEKTLLSSDLVAIFQRFWSSQGDIISNVLHNSILAFLSSAKGGTLIELKHFLVDKDFREEFLKTVEDEETRFYWRKEFPPLSRKITPLLTRLDVFLRSKLIRNILAQKDNKLDFRRIMDERKILLVKLTHGAIGEENAHLLGSLIIAKLYQAALSRQNIEESNRANFFVSLDEVHHFLVPSMALLLSGARKYGLSILASHQDTQQIMSRDADILSSLMTNCYTRICFRSDTDAEKLAKGFSFFTADHLKNLGVGEAVIRFEQSRFDFNLKTFPIEAVRSDIAEKRKKAIIDHTRKTYARPRQEVERPVLSLVSPKPQKETAISKDSVSRIPSPNQQIDTDKSNAQHPFLQNIIKRIGENSGFVATLEKQVFGGVGKVDVALENKLLKIACEIAVTNTIDYELQNIQKCLASGFDKVAVISSDAKHLANIRRKAEAIISDAQLSKVYFLEPDNFHLFLESLSQQTNIENKIKGYRVNVGFKETPEKEATSRKQTILEILSNVIRRKEKK